MKTIDKIITRVGTKYGAPMGRHGKGKFTDAVGRIYDQAVPMSGHGDYDSGGAYWGLGAQLRVLYDKGLNFIRFYREGDLLLNTCYHVFGDGEDDFVSTRGEANAIWATMVATGHTDLRMQLEQVLTDDDGAEPEHIVLLRYCGDFPH